MIHFKICNAHVLYSQCTFLDKSCITTIMQYYCPAYDVSSFLHCKNGNIMDDNSLVSLLSLSNDNISFDFLLQIYV